MRTYLWVAILVLAIIAIAIWHPFSRTVSPEASISSESAVATDTAIQTQNAAPAVNAKVAAPKGANTFKSLLTQSGSYQCDYDQVKESGVSHNVIYIYGGRLRGEFRTSINGNSTANLVVYDGHYLYQWREGTSVGTRNLLTSLSQLPLVIPKDLTSGQIYGTSYESVGWNCHNWLTNKSLLTPPSYVTFN